MKAKYTLYYTGMFGVRKMEATVCEVEVKPYAQYNDAVHVKYVEKGKRKVQGFVQGYKPSLLVLEGWGHPDPASMFNDPTLSPSGVVSRMSSYASCDPRWQSDFDAQMGKYLEKTGAKVLHDFRTKNSE